MTCLFTETWEHLHFRIGQVFFQEGNADISLGLICDLVHVKVDYMSGNFFVKRFKSLVSHNENCIETRKDGRLEVNLLSSMLEIVVSAVKWICSRQYGRTRVQDCRDACLGNRNRLLLHSLVNRDSVLRAHFIELIDADYAAVGEDHSATLQLKLSRRIVLNHRRSQTGGRRALTRGVDCDRSHPLDEL